MGIREGPVEKVTAERGSEGGEGGATAHLAGEGSKCFPTRNRKWAECGWRRVRRVKMS